MDQLIADGHDVILAEASNTPGLDLLVDAALAETAAQSDAPWAHLVTTVPGFEIATLEEQIAETLGHAADLADPEILQFALSIGALRGAGSHAGAGPDFRPACVAPPRRCAPRSVGPFGRQGRYLNRSDCYRSGRSAHSLVPQ